MWALTQGGPGRATLGWTIQSRWDRGIGINPAVPGNFVGNPMICEWGRLGGSPRLGCQVILSIPTGLHQPARGCAGTHYPGSWSVWEQP